RQDLGDERALLRHVLPDLIETGRKNTATALDDVLHELVWIAREWIEFQPGLLDHGAELPVGRDAHTVPLREPAPDGYERLDIASRADGHHDDGQRRHAWRVGRGRGRRGELAGMGLQPLANLSKRAPGVVEIHLKTSAGAR